MSSAAAASASCVLPAGGTEREQLANAVVALVNEHRARLGLRALRIAPALERAARWKARHMARHRYLSHWDAGAASRSPAQRLQACGYRGAAWGENIAVGFRDAQRVMQGWLGSPGHRANIQRPGWKRIGVAAAETRDGTVYWVQAFGA